jgi:L-lactate dehydrogenase
VDGPYGIEDVCLSAPCLVNRKGAGKVLEIDMSDEELKKYRASADFLKDVQRQVGF